jgi:hypothetical protein
MTLTILAFISVTVASGIAGFAAACLVFKPLLKEAQAMCDKSNEKLKSHAEEFRDVNDAKQNVENRYAILQGSLMARQDEIATLRSKYSQLVKKINSARVVFSEPLPPASVSGRTIDHTGSDSQDNTGAS